MPVRSSFSKYDVSFPPARSEKELIELLTQHVEAFGTSKAARVKVASLRFPTKEQSISKLAPKK
jgi:hypothetical protein